MAETTHEYLLARHTCEWWMLCVKCPVDHTHRMRNVRHPNIAELKTFLNRLVPTTRPSRTSVIDGNKRNKQPWAQLKLVRLTELNQRLLSRMENLSNTAGGQNPVHVLALELEREHERAAGFLSCNFACFSSFRVFE